MAFYLLTWTYLNDVNVDRNVLIPSRHKIPAGWYEIASLIQVDLAKFIHESTDDEADILVEGPKT